MSEKQKNIKYLRLFGGKFSFKYEGQEYKFKLPSKAGKFVDFFVR